MQRNGSWRGQGGGRNKAAAGTKAQAGIKGPVGIKKIQNLGLHKTCLGSETCPSSTASYDCMISSENLYMT